jgi:aryl-alcohol dehydrogenase-like predicted oxidoreductase
MIGYPFLRDFLPLGFGCSRLAGGRCTRESLRLLGTAFDAGIRYFDTARMYAGGEAEEVLGKFLLAHREDLIVTSKAGILPPAGDRARRWLRRAKKLSGLVFGTPMPRLRDYRFAVFDTPSLRQSVETSLRKLRTDWLDALLLHEVDLPHLLDGKVMCMLEDLRATGKIRAYGTASTREQTRRLIADYGRQVSIVQTASSVLEDGLKPLGDRSHFLTITHSVLAEALGKIMGQLLAEAAFREQWTAQVNVDPADREAVGGLLLAEAVDANEGGIVLFSSASPARIVAAANIARDKPYSLQQIHALRRLVAQRI